jgi:hypothetical protein
MISQKVLLRGSSIDAERSHDLLALIKFTSESDDQSLVSTENFFQQCPDGNIRHGSDNEDVEGCVVKEQDIIVRNLQHIAIETNR